MIRRTGAIRWVRRIGTAAALALLMPSLNYLFEFASRVAAQSSPDCPRYLSFAASLGLSWNICYFLTVVVFVLVADYGMSYCPKLERIPNWLIFAMVLVNGAVFMTVEHHIRHNIPLVGGVLGDWPDGYWDWPVATRNLAIALVTIWVASKTYSLIKRRRNKLGLLSPKLPSS